MRKDPKDGVQFVAVEAEPRCPHDVELLFLDFIPPDRTLVTVEYLSPPQ